MTLAVFHDFPGLEKGLTKFHDFSGRVVTLIIGERWHAENQLIKNGSSPVSHCCWLKWTLSSCFKTWSNHHE